MPKFSIIMPAYNVADYIGNSIISVQDQTFKDYELIVVEDCSTDNGKTLNTIKKFNSIKLVQNKINLGLGGARNEGIKVAQGEYIIFLDSDDILYNNQVLANINNIIANRKIDIVYMGFKFVGNRDITIIPNEENCKKEYKLGKDKYTNAWSKCLRREFILENDIWFPTNVIYEDVPFVFRVISLAKSYEIAPFITHVYTSGRSNSNASKNQFKQGRDTVTCIENLSNLVDKIDPKDIDLLKMRIAEQKERLIVRIDRVLDDMFIS